MALTLSESLIGAGTARRANVAAADSNVLATFEAAHGAAISIRGNSSFILFARLSAAGITATARPYFYDDDDNLLTIGPLATLDATIAEDSAGELHSLHRSYSVQGMAFVRIHLESISAGSLDLYMGILP